MRLFYCFLFFIFFTALGAQVKPPPYELKWFNDSIFPRVGTQVKAVCSDKDDNVFIAGHYHVAANHFGDLAWGAFVSEYTADGNLLWSDTIIGDVTPSIVGAVEDGSGNFFVLLMAPRRITAGGNDYTGFNSSFLLKYSKEGKILWSWNESYLSAFSIVKGSDNQIYISCHTNSPWWNRHFAGVYRFSPSGFLTLATDAHPYNMNFEADVDASGNIYVFTGYGAIWMDSKYFLSKYSAAGEIIWSKQMPLGMIAVNDEGDCFYSYTKERDTISILQSIATDGTIVWSDTLNYVVTSLRSENKGIYSAGYSRYAVVLENHSKSGDLLVRHLKSHETYNNHNIHTPLAIRITGRSVYYAGTIFDREGSNTGFLVKLQRLETTSMVEERNPHALNLFPNPSAGMVTLKSPLEHPSILVTDVNGKIVFNHTTLNSEENLNLSHLTDGVYTMRIQNAAACETKKIIIKK